MKFKLFFTLILSFYLSYSQNDKLQWLDLMLTNYEYPYDVEYISVSTQEQNLTMAYMNVKPDNFNGKTIGLRRNKKNHGIIREFGEINTTKNSKC